MPKTKRVSMTLPVDLVADLDSVSTKLQVSRSSLISEILSSNISPIREIIDTIVSISPTEGTTLSRDPNKVRDYLDAFSAAIESASKDYENSKNDLIHTLEGLNNEH